MIPNAFKWDVYKYWYIKPQKSVQPKTESKKLVYDILELLKNVELLQYKFQKGMKMKQVKHGNHDQSTHNPHRGGGGGGGGMSDGPPLQLTGAYIGKPASISNAGNGETNKPKQFGKNAEQSRNQRQEMLDKGPKGPETRRKANQEHYLRLGDEINKLSPKEQMQVVENESEIDTLTAIASYSDHTDVAKAAYDKVTEEIPGGGFEVEKTPIGYSVEQDYDAAMRILANALDERDYDYDTKSMKKNSVKVGSRNSEADLKLIGMIAELATKIKELTIALGHEEMMDMETETEESDVSLETAMSKSVEIPEHVRDFAKKLLGAMNEQKQ